MIIKVEKPSNKLTGAPKSSAPWPPAKSLKATGIKVIPMIVTTVPVTTGGKNRINLLKIGAINTTIRPEIKIEP